MTRSKVSLFLLIVLLATAINATAQPMDRPALLSKIESQREQLRAKEAAFLLPSEEDFASFRDFLLQPDTGLVRLMPREKYDGEMLIRGGGAYYSFVKLTNAYGGGSDIALELLVAFRIVSQDDDGSVVIVWKILKKFPSPQLTIANASPGKV